MIWRFLVAFIIYAGGLAYCVQHISDIIVDKSVRYICTNPCCMFYKYFCNFSSDDIDIIVLKNQLIWRIIITITISIIFFKQVH